MAPQSTGPELHSSSHMAVITDSAPHPFTRQRNTDQAYTSFSTMWIQHMDQFYSQIPRMPLVLKTHDVHRQEWSAFMDSLALAWKGNLPLPEFVKNRPPSRSSIVADLINLWNESFFLPRRVEVVLYKGRERRSGPHAGKSDHRLQLPKSESANERERKYALYIVSYDPIQSTSLEHTSRGTGTECQPNPASYNFYF